MTPADTYIARYRFTPFAAVMAPFAILVVIGSTGILAGAAVLQSLRPETSQSGRTLLGAAAVVAVLVGGFLVAVTLGPIRAATERWIALQVDRDGVTLGRRPFPGSRALSVPWEDIEEVVLFYYPSVEHRGGGPIVGLRLTPTAVCPSGGPPPGTARGRLYHRLMTTPKVPADVYIGVRGWYLNRSALTAAVRAFAPATRVVDRSRRWNRAGSTP
jgi:hypothetical protein